MKPLELFWHNAKLWRKIQLGPISIIYRMGRTVRVSSNFRRRLFFTARNFLPNPAIPFDRSLTDSSFEQNQPVRVHRPEVALVVGAGPGLGFAVAKKLTGAGMHVALACRNAEPLDGLVNELTRAGNWARAYGCDATDELSVKKLFRLVFKDVGVPNLVIYAVQDFSPGRALDIKVPAFEESWRQNCLGGFIVAREAARSMVNFSRGTIVLIGSTSGMVARADHLNLAVGKFGLRAIAQVMARELWSSGIHVIHIVIDGEIREQEPEEPTGAYAESDHIAELIYLAHRQPKTAWTSEMDVRPWNERFWEHC